MLTLLSYTFIDRAPTTGELELTVSHRPQVGEQGVAVGVDHIEELVAQSRRNIQKDQPHLLSSGRVELVTGDGRLGYPPRAPYDAIHVGAAAPVLPETVSPDEWCGCD